MYPGVTNVEATAGHALILGFDNGEVRCFDARPLFGFGRFRELASVELFLTARVSFDAVEWENGLDLDPEYLYRHSTPVAG